MKVRLQYYGQLRHLAERDFELVETDGSTDLVTLLRKVARQYDDRFSGILFHDTEKLTAAVMVLVNEEPAQRHLLPALRDGDVVSLIPAISGG